MFDGRGLQAQVCQDCRAQGKSAVNQALNLRFLDGLLRQSHISPGNVLTLHAYARSDDSEVAAQARDLLLVAALAPYRKRRWKKLARLPIEMRERLRCHDECRNYEEAEAEGGCLYPIHDVTNLVEEGIDLDSDLEDRVEDQSQECDLVDPVAYQEWLRACDERRSPPEG